ncbi:MAG: HEAT repeat domain-containing protein [Anaerolineae bacterium]|nr:HEAT repeat domain-containing protein [Anaerolineae bacterium]MDK1081995.1 HEAT repeat domain-containing protein [Anaerolineae bacterium]MDK1119170.1 HEAT repeat domain-containing protein [Anaerolineae bacterium]
MNEELIPFQGVLDVLLDENKDITRLHLTEFSDIDPTSLKALNETWPRIELSRKLLLLDKLYDLAEKDTLVAFDELGKSLLNDSEPGVILRALRLLNECQDVRLFPTYLDLLTSNDDVKVRAEAASILGLYVNLGEFDEIPENIHHQIEDALLDILNGEDEPFVRRYALEALGFSSRVELPVLIESAYNREDPDWMASAVFAMGRSNNSERWAEQVLHEILSENPQIRLAAIQAAGKLELEMARPILLDLLEEEFDDQISEAAIWSLSQIGGENVRAHLENLLDAHEDDDQTAILEDALDNLVFTEDMTNLNLMALDADEPKEIDLEE